MKQHFSAATAPLCLIVAVAAFLAAVAEGDDADLRIEPVPPDPLAGSPAISPSATGRNVEEILASLLPERSDSPIDWFAGPEPLHFCNEPRALPPCVPPPPCHPSEPPHPLDLVGAGGVPSCGPIYRGPCQPRTGSRDDRPLPWLHRIPDRLFDLFYTPK